MKKYLSITLLFLLLSCAASKQTKQDSPTPKPPKTQQPTKVDLHQQIIQESKPGGGLDYFTSIKGHESESVEVKDGVFSTRLGLALYDWGKATYGLGVKSSAEAMQIWEAFKGRAANTLEKEQIALGFRRGME